MKKLILSCFIFLPLLLIVNDGNVFFNLVGVAYAVSLFFASRTGYGKKFVDELHDYVDRLTDRILKDNINQK